MFDIGWQELFIIAALAVIVIGPKELPRVLRTAAGMVRKARMLAAEFQGAINDAAHEADLDDLKNHLRENATVDTSKIIENSIDPTGNLRRELTAIERGEEYTGEHEDPAVEEGAIDEDDDYDDEPEDDEDDDGDKAVEAVEDVAEEAKAESIESDQTPATTPRKSDHG
jgi:sec-independent protein translocase protein TatB